MRQDQESSSGRGVTAAAPASVGNLSCGFDVLGLALQSPSDRVTARPRAEAGVEIAKVLGDEGLLPREAGTNAAGVAARALLARTGAEARGVSLELRKGIPLAGGLGGSAASAAAAVTAVNALLNLEAGEEVLLDAALEGERAAAGSPHPDNVAPALFGGLVLARLEAKRRVIHLPVPDGMAVTVLHQPVHLETSAARAAVGTHLPLEDGVRQWGNTAALVAALHTGDWELMGDALVDRVAEPRRAEAIPGFEVMREAALRAGAVAFGISGAGPTVFAVCRDSGDGERVGEAMATALGEATGGRGRYRVSGLPAPGARTTEDGVEGVSWH